MSNRLRRRYGHARKGASAHEELLQDAMKDWLSGRAYLGNKGKRFILRDLVRVGGQLAVVSRGRKSPPWNKAVFQEWPENPSTELHRRAFAAYGHRTKHELLQEMAEKRGEA